MASSGPRGGSEGEQLGSYRLVRKLGRGGMGEVWLAEHDTIKSQVAIKLVLADPDNEDAASRFLREAKATARIRHPGVVNVTDFGPRKAGGAYLVMELLDGESLADRIERGALSSDLAIDLGVQIAEALAAAHAAGVVHRDLKPANIFLVRDAATRSDVRVKLVDFGVAKATGKVTDELGMTLTGALVGTPVYMAPEQCTTRKGPVDHRADLYALGVVLYEILTGKPPFRGPTLGDLIDQHINEAPVSPRTVVPSIPAKLDVLIMTLLAKDRADRPSSANEVARVLHELRGTTPSATLAETMASGARPATSDPSVDETLASGDRPKTSAALPASSAQVAPMAAVTNIEPRPVPKALIWGLAGGFVLFCGILVVIVTGRQRGDLTKPPVPTDPTAACEKGDATSCFAISSAEIKAAKPDLVKIASWMRHGCEAGAQKACVRLGYMYLWGAGVRSDIGKARELAMTACDRSDGAGCDLAADLTPVTSERPGVAAGLWSKGCDLGEAFACESYGRHLRFGSGVKADPAKSKAVLTRAFELATKSCEGDDAAGCRVLGIVYLRGDGVAADPNRGVEKLQRACDLGSAEACGEVGEIYAIGANGVNKDPERARIHIEMSCARGASSACMTLAVAQSMGLLGEPADPTKAFATAKFACEERSPRACVILGNFYNSGTGTPVDAARAAEVYERACEVGDADACAQAASLPKYSMETAKGAALLQRACDLGSSYGCKKIGDIANKAGEFDKAARLYEQSCTQSDLQTGCPQLATAYFEGRGVPKDEARGRKLLEDACHENAMVVCHALGTRLRDGKGFDANPIEALRTFEKACGLGWADSCVSASKMLESRAYGIASDPKRAKEMHDKGCALDPRLCTDKPRPEKE